MVKRIFYYLNVKAIFDYKMIKEIIIMNTERAQEIVSSPIMANVTYNGTPIYIESVNANRETASIHFLKNPNNSREVSLTNLQEHQK